MSWLWYVLGALVLLLLLAWLLGWFGSEVAEEVGTGESGVGEETDEAVVIEETEEPVEEEAVVTEDGEPLVTEDGDAVVTEEAVEEEAVE